MSDSENNVEMKTGDQPTLEVLSSRHVKIQPFWPQKPQNWFLLAEIQYDLQGVKSEKDRFLHTLSSLSPETCDQISDFLANPPTTAQYTQLKAILLDRLAPSSERQLEALISGQDIGDRKPSDALRHIRTLAGTNFPDNIIRSLWVRKMPEIIKIALVAQPETITTDILAKTADRMHEIIALGQQQTQLPTLAPINMSVRQSRPQERSDRGPSTSQNSFDARLSRLEQKLNGFIRERSRGRSQSRSPSRSPSNYSRRHGRCWYHAKFGTAAKKCIQPCNFTTSQQATSHNISKMDVSDNSKNA